MTDSGWLHYRDLKSRCPTCKRPAHIAERDGDFYFVDDEYNPFVRHAPVKTTEAVFRFFANGYRRETGNQFVSLSDAARAVGLRNGNSIRRAIDRGGTAGGYHWGYLDERKEVSTDDHYQADGRAE